MKPYLAIYILLLPVICLSQPGWTICNTPAFSNRVDDIFMLNEQTGYAVCGDGKTVKTTDGGKNWLLVNQVNNVYNRSVEFVTEQKGFVGGFSLNNAGSGTNILRSTTNGGTTWTDLSPLLHPRARQGICGLAAPDINTIYGCGNYYKDSAYIVKSVDGGNTWAFIDMSSYATSLIDMFFINKDIGFATGKGPKPLETAVILYTTDGGSSWVYKFQNTVASEYCWKIQRLNSQVFFASIEDNTLAPAKVLKSVDGGNSWTVKQVAATAYNIEGIGFIDTQKGWTGGDAGYSFESRDGGNTWLRINICPAMNRVFKVNDTLLFATGDQIWKYAGSGNSSGGTSTRYVSLKAGPNPVKGTLTIKIKSTVDTRIMLLLFDEKGNKADEIANENMAAGDFTLYYKTHKLAAGVYTLLLKTHEDKVVQKILISR